MDDREGLSYFKKSYVPKPKWNEGKLQHAINENAKAVFGKSVGVVVSEFRLHDPMSLLSGELDGFVDQPVLGTIGRIDLVLKYRGKYYVCEIKYKNDVTDFWDALKVLGYRTYFEWQTNQKATAAIIMPLERVKLEHKIIAGRLGVQLIGATLHPDGSYSCSFLEQ